MTTKSRSRARRLLWLLMPLAVLALSCSLVGGLLPTPLATLPVPINWRQKIDEFPSSPFAVADGMVVYQDEPGVLQGHDAANGRRKWSYKLERGVRELFQPVPITQGLLFVMDDSYEGPTAGDGWVSAIEVQTGQEKWRLPVGDETDDRWFAEPAVADGVVFFESGFGQPQHSLSAANVAGSLLWTTPLDGSLAAGPVVDGSQVFAAIRENAPAGADVVVRLAAFDAATGREGWSIRPPDAPRVWLAAADGRLYLGTRAGQIYGLDEANGGTLWQVAPLSGQLEEFALSDGALYLADESSSLLSLNPADGSQRWSVTIDGYIKSTPIAAGGLVYAGTGYGALYALDANTGAQQWVVHTLLHKAFPDMKYYPEMENAPAVANGVLYYSDTQYLLAIQVP
ncbi:MAG: PQQ-binding-like beta-propeller repeat protein [Anaerolineales bacterium]